MRAERFVRARDNLFSLNILRAATFSLEQLRKCQQYVVQSAQQGLSS